MILEDKDLVRGRYCQVPCLSEMDTLNFFEDNQRQRKLALRKTLQRLQLKSKAKVEIAREQCNEDFINHYFGGYSGFH